MSYILNLRIILVCIVCLSRFIYTDDVIITKNNALHLMYAAKKYIILALEQKCTAFINSNLITDNVCTILTQSMAHSHDALRQRYGSNVSAVYAFDN